MKNTIFGVQFLVAALAAISLAPVRSDRSPFFAEAGPQIAFSAIAPPRASFSALASYGAVQTAVSEERIYASLVKRSMGLDERGKRHVARAIVREASRYRLPPELVLAVIDTESSYRANARSGRGALGLMQILPGTGRSLARDLGMAWQGDETLFDPLVNVRLGTHYLASLHRRFRRLDTALAAYNWGPTRITELLRAGAPVPQIYSRKVLESRRAL